MDFIFRLVVDQLAFLQLKGVELVHEQIQVLWIGNFDTVHQISYKGKTEDKSTVIA